MAELDRCNGGRAGDGGHARQAEPQRTGEGDDGLTPPVHFGVARLGVARICGPIGHLRLILLGLKAWGMKIGVTGTSPRGHPRCVQIDWKPM